jgi:hypothetical protein
MITSQVITRIDLIFSMSLCIAFIVLSSWESRTLDDDPHLARSATDLPPTLQGRKFSKPRQLHRRVLSAPNEQSVRQRGLLDHLRVLSRSSMWGQKASVFTVSSSVRLDTGKQVPEQSLSFLTNVNDPGISDVGQITRNNPYWALAPFLLQARPPENEPDASEDLNLFKDQNSIQAQKST